MSGRRSETLYPPTSSVYSSPRRSISGRSTIIQIEDPVIDEIQKAREERRTTGRFVAVVVALSLILLSCYHAWIRRTAVLASVIVPALIMVLYTAWVLYSAKRDKYRRHLASRQGMPLFLTSVLTMGSTRTFGPLPLDNTLDYSGQEPGRPEHGKRRRRRRRHRTQLPLSQEYRNMVLQEIPPFNAKAVEALGAAALTHNIRQPCTLEVFEEDPDLVRRSHLVMCRSHSVG